MSHFSLTPKEQRDCELGVEKFRHAHPDEEWTIKGMRGQGGLTLTVRGTRVPYAVQIVVNPVLDMSESVFVAMEQFRDRLKLSRERVER